MITVATMRPLQLYPSCTYGLVNYSRMLVIDKSFDCRVLSGENALEQNILTFVHTHASYCNVSDLCDIKGAAFFPYLLLPLVCSNYLH